MTRVLLAFFSWIVPSVDRDDWRREWLAEFACASADRSTVPARGRISVWHALRAVMAAMDPGVPVFRARTMAEFVARVGLAIAVLMRSAVATLLVGVQANDVPTYTGVAAATLVAAVAAAWIPARRAARVDPVLALRAE